MSRNPTTRSRQRGAVAVMAGLMAVTLFAFGGVVLDLGHLYIAKSELQNAADAAALAGAKELNNTLKGIQNALFEARRVAQEHNYDFNKPVTIRPENIRFGPCSDPAKCEYKTADKISTEAAAMGMTFIEVNTGLQDLNTYLMRVQGNAFSTTRTFGYAIAGHYETLVTPIGVCAVDPGRPTATYSHDVTGGGKLDEFVELGFRWGVTYNLFKLNPLPGSGNSDPYLINPVDTPASAGSSEDDCKASHSSADFVEPFLCTGTSKIRVDTEFVYTNTGLEADKMADALNTRFGMYKKGAGAVCTNEIAPPDANIKQYWCKGTGPECQPPAKTPSQNVATIGWMTDGKPTVAYVRTRPDDAPSDPNKPEYWSSANPLSDLPIRIDFASYGPLWSYAWPRKPGSGSKPGNKITPSETDNTNMYDDSNMVYFENYPLDPTNGKPTPPYQTTSGPYFSSGGTQGVRDRRVLNVVIVDCSVTPAGANICGKKMKVLGIGRFFMQTPADFTGGPEKRALNGEFAGLLDRDLPAEIMLFR